MKAVVYTIYGGPEVLQIKEVEKPFPKDNEVLVKVYAVSLNDWDCGLLQGDFVNRLLNGFRKPKRKILGSDIAGRIESVGKNVTWFKPGDDVYGDLSGQWGGFAEYVCAPEKALTLKPAAMSFEEAAAIPQAAMLAVQGLIDKGKIHAGQKLLINGAGGGVGSFAIQIARQYGVEVTGVDSTGKLEMLSSLGFDHVIDYTREDFTKNGRCYDLILDVKTNRSLFDYARALCRRGAYVTVGGSMRRLLEALFLAPWMSIISKKHIRIVALKPNKDLAYMNQLFEAGKIKPVIDGPYRLSEVPDVFRLFIRGDHKGKVVITIHADEGKPEQSEKKTLQAFKVRITGFIDDHQPGWVECKFTDAWGTEHIVREKVPVVTEKNLDANSEYPQDGFIAFELIRKWTDPDGRTIYKVNTDKPWYVETMEGLTEFDILEEQTVEVNW